MKKIKLGGIEYELPKISTKVMAELEENGYEISKGYIFKNLVHVLSYVTKKSVDEVYELIDKDVEKGEFNFAECNEIVVNWLTKSDFFQKAIR